jgi:hypothetical protein
LKIELKGHHFDIIEVIEAELQAVLNTLTEHYFQNAFKNGRSARKSEYVRKLANLGVIVASRSKVNF